MSFDVVIDASNFVRLVLGFPVPATTNQTETVPGRSLGTSGYEVTAFCGILTLLLPEVNNCNEDRPVATESSNIEAATVRYI